jgi:GWxTD domain-containing protein
MRLPLPSRRGLLAALFAATTLPALLPAQQAWLRENRFGPQGADTLSPGAVADSLAVLRGLDSLLLREPDNAAAWFRRGMIAWSLSIRDTLRPPVSGTDWRVLGRVADTSLRRAAQAAPGDARYHLAAGRFLLASGDPFARSGATALLQRAVEAARQQPDAWIRADAALEAGRDTWRRYDQFAQRLPTTSGALRSLTAGLQTDDGTPTCPLRCIVDGARDATRFFGTSDGGSGYYLQAEALFREAYEAVPEHPRAFRHFAMLMAEKGRWPELATLARDRTARAPWDQTGWMALGLALHRRQDSEGAQRAFEQALEAMTPEEFARLDRLDRILRPVDTIARQQQPEDRRTGATRAYWLLADPLWSQPGNEMRVEFLARVAYAELRWTIDELGVRGADSDRGDVHIRYGPPDIVLAWGGEPDDPSGRDISILWAYERNDLAFVFLAPPSYGTARVPQIDRALVDGIRDAIPVRFDNTTRLTIDTLPLQVVRFRTTASADSVDLVVAARPPVTAIAEAAEVREPVRSDLWLLGDGLQPVRRDSQPAAKPGTQWWPQRVAAGGYVVRAEASGATSPRAARALLLLQAQDDPTTGFALRGYGMSDVLLANRAAAARGRSAARWSDLELQPLAGALTRGEPLAVVWETYGLGDSDGRSAYTVTITLTRERGAVGRVTARVLQSVGASVAGGDDEVVVRYERAGASGGIALDHVDLALGDTPGGRYKLTVQVTDKATGRQVERVTRFEVEDAR